MPSIGVVHLVRQSNGLEPLREFLQSYAKHRAGEPHDLLIVFKGFGTKARGPWDDLLAPFPHQVLEVDDAGLDLGAYFRAVHSFGHDYLLFLNSYSRILCDDWLTKLHEHGRRPGVGAVGAAGSWESMYTTWLDDNRTAGFWKTLRPKFKARTRQMYEWFPPLPNHHLRTNAFMAPRELLASLTVPALLTKEDTHRFESGRKGLSSQIRERGRELLVVGRDGRAYAGPEWPRSCTFRAGDQCNLLIADNQTEAYLKADDVRRRRLAMLAWGAYHPSCP